MANYIGNFLRQITGGQGYQLISSGESGAAGNTMPGHFPEEPVIPNSRRRMVKFDSIAQSIRHTATAFSYAIIKPVIYLLVILFRLVAKVINTLYFKYHSSCSRARSNTTTNGSLNPIDKVNKFIRDLEEGLSPQTTAIAVPGEGTQEERLPPFFLGSYTQALYMATNRGKFLFVYLTNVQNENSSSMFNKIVTNPNFISIFRENDHALIWGGDLTNPEAYQLANSLNVTVFPFIGLLCLTRTTTMSPQGPVKTSPKISLILKVQGKVSSDVDADAFIDRKFKSRMEKFLGELTLMRNELRDKYISQILLKQQEQNYQASLRKDQLKKKEKLDKKLRADYLSWRAPYFLQLQQDSDTRDKAKIAIKFKSGERVIFFFPSQNPIEDIFTYVELHAGGYLNDKNKGNEALSSNHNPAPSSSSSSSNFQNLQLNYNFKLVSPLPPKETLNNHLNAPDQVRICDLDCVYPNGLLVVEDL